MSKKYIANSFQVPNAFVDDLLPQMSQRAIVCYLFILRKTVGWQKTKDKISFSQIKQALNMRDKRTVDKAINELEEFGLIKVTRERGKINVFELITDDDLTDEVGAQNAGTFDAEMDKLGASCADKLGASCADKLGASCADKLGANYAPLQNPILQNPSLQNTPLTPQGENNNHQSQKSKAKKPRGPTKHEQSISALTGIGVSRDNAEAWLDVRKAKKAGPINKVVIDAIQREASKAGITADDAVRICAERSWQGFSADWITSKTKPDKLAVNDKWGRTGPKIIEHNTASIEEMIPCN